MTTHIVALAALVGMCGAAMAQAPASTAPAAMQARLICFGNEPSWAVTFGDGGEAQLALPDQRPVQYRGSETRLDVLGEWAWRGKPVTGGGGELVAFLGTSACSDGMSDDKHPVTARISLADGRFLAGCCRVAPAPTPATPLALTIEGPTWRLVSLRGTQATPLAAAKPPVTAEFAAGRVTGFSGCNRFTGSYAIDGDRITVGSLAATMMACPEPQMAIENAVQAALAGTFRYAVLDRRLTLSMGSEPVLVFAAAPAPVLEGVTWRVTGFNNGRQAVVSPLPGTALAVTFRAGAVNGRAGCNRFRATYIVAAGGIAIGPVTTTRLACADAGVMQQEREFLAALSAATTWTLRDGMLDLHRADGERALIATAGDE